MSTPTRFFRAALLVACAGLGATAQAAPFTINFAGIVSQVQFDPTDPLGGAVAPGGSLYTYVNLDSAAVDAAPAPDLGSYTVSGGTYGVAAVINSIVFPVMRSVNISVVDGAAGSPDLYSLFAWEGTAGGLGDYFTLSMLLQDDTGTALTGDALPLSAPDPGRFGVRSFRLAGQYTDLTGQFIQYEVMGHLIPEPGSLALAGLALALGGWARTRAPRARA